MGYYLITSAEYIANHSSIGYEPVYTLDQSQCIIEVEDNYTVSNYIQYFETGNDVNEFRFSESEWSNWMSSSDYYGE